MLSKSLLTLLVALPLYGCVVPEKFTQPAKTFQFDWPEKGIKATAEYNTRQVSGYEYRSRCAGEITIENYGNKNFGAILVELSFYSSSKQLVAKNSFRLSSGLISGGKANLPADYSNPLDSPEGSKYFTECPDSMNSANSRLIAY